MSKSKLKLQPQTISESTKSESGSTDRTKKKRKYSINRLLSGRNVNIREAEQDDIKWLWVAYNKGVFEKLFEKGLNKEEFVMAVHDTLAYADNIYIMEADNEVARPVGTVVMINRGFHEEYYEPFFDWFPWSTDRNKIETAVKSILDLRKKYKNLFIQTHDDGKKFVTHVAKYGILRRVGNLDQGDNKVYLFESMRIK